MIPEKIKALFEFIDYLDENKTEYIEKYLPLCDELKVLDTERNNLKPNENYSDKQKYDSIQNQIEKKFSPITLNIYNPVTNKLKELEIWSGDKTYTSIWNNNISEITEFKRNFKSEDIKIVIEYKQKYLKFRTETNTDFLCLTFIFNALDDVLKELFDFFKDSKENEFNNFETKTIQVNSIEKAVKGLIENKGKNVKYTFPDDTLFKKPNENELTNNHTNIKNEIIMGDKFQTGDISNHNGNISVGKDIKTKTSGNSDLEKKSYNWQKWGIIVGTIIGIIAIITSIL
jgi:hypothetical protein